MNQICIWCRREASDATFSHNAHIFPKSIGGKRFCKDVCDSCNLYFGSKQTGLPSIEVALKEPLNISRLFLLSQQKQNKRLPRFKSEYFDYDLKRQILKPKSKYRLSTDFQKIFTKQFKRGIFKIFLEERSESIGDALSPQFDFVREFSRYGIGDYPVFYCQPKISAVFVSSEDLENPIIRFTSYSENIMQQYGFYCYYFMTHSIAIPVIRTFEITMDNYMRFLLSGENSIFNKITPLREMSDLDFIFSFAFNNK